MTIQTTIKRAWYSVRRIFWVIIFLWALSASGMAFREYADQIRGLTRTLEFDYARWVMQALLVKGEQMSAGFSHHLTDPLRSDLVREYFQTVKDIQWLEFEIERLYTDPEVSDPQQAAAGRQRKLETIQLHHDELQPLAESILQEQVAVVLADLGMTMAGLPIPPPAFHFSETPFALIVSPRTVIRQDANIDLLADMSLTERIDLEEAVDRQLDVSTLVVATGGIGVYPTMVLESSAQSWILETIVHEWIHNYLTWHPLGLNYDTSPELRTINETIATLLGREIGQQVIRRYYPELVPPQSNQTEAQTVIPTAAPPEFDFHSEMRETRVNVEEYLAAGQIQQAEAYMEKRRELFWEEGYAIRKLNQAYFAFHGAYAAQPGGGAAGADPIGAAVRELWQQMADPAAFLKRVAWIDEPEDLFRMLETQTP